MCKSRQWYISFFATISPLPTCSHTSTGAWHNTHKHKKRTLVQKEVAKEDIKIVTIILNKVCVNDSLLIVL
jgi:hypothetical protein